MNRYKALALLIVLIFGACSSDDNNDLTQTEALIGIWQPKKEVEVYIDNTTSESEYSICHQKSRYTFTENGSLQITEYTENEITGECVERDEPVLVSGEWIKEPDGKYRLITVYRDTRSQQTYTDNNVPEVFQFENNNNILKIGYSDDEIIDGKQLKYYYTEFSRVN